MIEKFARSHLGRGRPPEPDAARPSAGSGGRRDSIIFGLNAEGMMRAAGFVITLIAVTLWALSARAASIAPEQAASHVGQTATVCGTVASAHYAPRARSQPTFLDLDKAYPNEIFTAVIFGADRAKFGSPETALRDKRICVIGQIRRYRGRPEIILRDRGQLTQ